jgi:hypothetical protein
VSDLGVLKPKSSGHDCAVWAGCGALCESGPEQPAGSHGPAGATVTVAPPARQPFAKARTSPSGRDIRTSEPRTYCPYPINLHQYTRQNGTLTSDSAPESARSHLGETERTPPQPLARRSRSRPYTSRRRAGPKMTNTFIAQTDRDAPVPDCGRVMSVDLGLQSLAVPLPGLVVVVRVPVRPV